MKETVIKINEICKLNPKIDFSSDRNLLQLMEIVHERTLIKSENFQSEISFKENCLNYVLFLLENNDIGEMIIEDMKDAKWCEVLVEDYEAESISFLLPHLSNDLLKNGYKNARELLKCFKEVDYFRFSCGLEEIRERNYYYQTQYIKVCEENKEVLDTLSKYCWRTSHGTEEEKPFDFPDIFIKFEGDIYSKDIYLHYDDVLKSLYTEMFNANTYPETRVVLHIFKNIELKLEK